MAAAEGSRSCPEQLLTEGPSQRRPFAPINTSGLDGVNPCGQTEE